MFNYLSLVIVATCLCLVLYASQDYIFVGASFLLGTHFELLVAGIIKNL